MQFTPLIVATYHCAPRHVLAVLAAAVMLLIAGSASAARVTKMEVMTPTPHGAAAGVSEAQVRGAVVRAAEYHGWASEVLPDGRVRAERTIKNGKHSATVTISIDGPDFMIRYATSNNLGYQPIYCINRALGNQRTRQARPCSDRGIHPYYNDWVEALAATIEQDVGQLRPVAAGVEAPGALHDPMTPRERFEISEKMRDLIARHEAGSISDEQFEQSKRELLLR